MATVVFTDSSVRTVKSVVDAEAKSLKVLPDKSFVNVIDLDYNASKIESTNYPILKPRKSYQQTTAESILPFRIKFTSIGIEGYTANRPAPIGIAVIGVNNYIL
jgi:hypothetical protein